MMPALSVIICTHNPRPDYLRRALDALKVQTLPKEQWELLLIDNASKEALANSWDLSWHPHARHIREEELGLTPARLRGIKESQGEFLIFVDDDNVLAPNYCEVLLRLGREFPRIGCFGAGIIEPEFEAAPALELKPYLNSLALRSAEKTAWSNNPKDGIIPWGAGLGACRHVADSYLSSFSGCQLRQKLGRCSSNLMSSEDDEFSWIACETGYGKGLFPELKLIHLIAAWRTERSYLLKLAEGQAFSRTILAHLHDQPLHSPRTPSTFAEVLRGFFSAKLSTTLHHANSWWFYRHKSELEKNFDQAERSGVEAARKRLAEMKTG